MKVSCLVNVLHCATLISREVLDNAGKDAFQKYLDLGGTFVGIHSASDTLRNTTFYIRELGMSREIVKSE